MSNQVTKSVRDIPRLSALRGRTFMSEIKSDRLGMLLRMSHECGDIGQVSGLAGGVLVMVNSPALVHAVLVDEARAFEKSPVLRSSLFPLAGLGLFTSEGELWKRQRKLMAPMFHTAQIARFADVMVACAARSADGWVDGTVVDVAREMTHVTMAIAGKTLFDIETFSESDELGEALTTALAWAGNQSASPIIVGQARLRTLLLLAADHLPRRVEPFAMRAADALLRPLLLPTKANRELERALVVLEDRVARMIADRRSQNDAPRDVLSLLLGARDEDGERMSDRQVRDEILTLFVAGHETTATALAWALMLLTTHPEAYARARAEVDSLGREPTYADLPALGYCTRVFKEAMRLYPPVYLYGRQAITDVDIGEYRLPKGTIVLISPWSLQRRASIWPDPDRFDPDRFLPEREATRHRSAFIPFSSGPRVCIGNHFALMEGPLVLAAALRAVDFETTGAPIEPEPLATLRPRSVPLRVRRRAPACTPAGRDAGPDGEANASA